MIRNRLLLCIAMLTVLQVQLLAKSCQEQLCCLIARLHRIEVLIELLDITIQDNRCSPTFIRQQDLPYVISAPGLYILVQDAVYDPVDDTPAITINASHVVLDLCSNRLFQNPLNMTPDVVGIYLAPGHHDIEIRNGGIADMTAFGIFGQSDGIGINLSIVYLHDLTLTDNGMRNGVPFARGILPLGINGGIFFQGFEGSIVENIVIENVQVNRSGVINGRACGIGMERVRHVALRTCIADDTTATGVGDAAGIFFLGSNDVDILECTANGSIASNNAMGFSLQGSFDLEISQCSSHGHLVIPVPAFSNTRATNFDLSGTSNVRLRECTAFDTRNDKLANEGTGNGAAGYYIADSFNVLMQQCFTSRIVAHNDYSAGFLVLPNSQHIECIDCRAIDISNDNLSESANPNTLVGMAAGFSTANSSNFGLDISTLGLIIDHCNAQNVSAQLGRSVGFLLYNSRFGLVENCIAQEIKNSQVTTTGRGFQFDSTPAVTETKCFVKNNIAHNNNFAGFVNNSDNLSFNVFCGNYSYHNNEPNNYYESNTGMSGTLGASEGQIKWFLSSGPAPLTCQHPELDNFDIRQSETGPTGASTPICSLLPTL